MLDACFLGSVVEQPRQLLNIQIMMAEKQHKKTIALKNLVPKETRRTTYTGLTNDDECRFCYDISSTEDVIHLVCECPAVENVLQKLGSQVILRLFRKLNINRVS